MASVAEHVARRILEMQGFTRRTVPTSVGPTHVLEARGDGSLPPMILLHGFAASGTQLLPILRRLRRHASRLIVPDLPGHGFSAVPSGGVGNEAFQTGLFELLDTVVDEPMVVFGNSMGGFIAVRYALERSEKVRRLILCSPGGAAMTQSELDEFRKTFLVENHADAVEFVDRLLGKRSRFRHLVALSVRRRLTQASLRDLIQSVTPSDLLEPEQVRTLAMPILMVWGQADGILPGDSREFFRTHLPPHARIVEPERLGHSPYLESPKALTRLIVDFASEDAPRAPGSGAVAGASA